MAKNKKPAKKYKPKGVLPDPVSWVLDGLKPLTSLVGANVDLRIKNRQALEAVAKGRGNSHDVAVLAAASNMAMALKLLGFKVDWADELREGADAVEALRDRYNATGKALCWAQELHALKVMMSVHDDQLDDVDVQTIERALAIVEKKQAVAV